MAAIKTFKFFSLFALELDGKVKKKIKLCSSIKLPGASVLASKMVILDKIIPI